MGNTAPDHYKILLRSELAKYDGALNQDDRFNLYEG